MNFSNHARLLSLATLGLAFHAHTSSYSTATNSPNIAVGQTAPGTGNMYQSDSQIDAHFSSSDFIPDGDLSKLAWKNATWIEFNRDKSGEHAYPEAATQVAALWTASHVYFAFRSKYTMLNIYQGEDAKRERYGLWDRDVVEVFLNPHPEHIGHYFEFEVAPNNQWIDLEIDREKKPSGDHDWNSGFEHAAVVDEKNRVWICEMRIPIAALGAEPLHANTKWRLNLFRIDGPGDDTQRRFLAWSKIPEGKSFHVPKNFGVIRFVQ